MPSPEFWIIHSAHTDRWVAIFPNSLKTTLRRKKSETGKLSLKYYLFNSPGRISQTSHPPTMSIMGTGITAEQICVPPPPPPPPSQTNKQTAQHDPYAWLCSAPLSHSDCWKWCTCNERCHCVIAATPQQLAEDGGEFISQSLPSSRVPVNPC